MKSLVNSWTTNVKLNTRTQVFRITSLEPIRERSKSKSFHEPSAKLARIDVIGKNLRKFLPIYYYLFIYYLLFIYLFIYLLLLLQLSRRLQLYDKA